MKNNMRDFYGVGFSGSVFLFFELLESLKYGSIK